MFVLGRAPSASDWRTAVFKPPAAAMLFIVAASFAGMLMWRIEAAQSHVAETLFPFAAAGFGIAAILLAYSARTVFRHSSRLTECSTFLGRVSYSLYLFHLSVAMTIAPHLAGLSVALQLAIYLGICIALSAVFYRIFERPILAMRPGYRRSDEAPAIDAALLAAPAKSAA